MNPKRGMFVETISGIIDSKMRHNVLFTMYAGKITDK